MIDHGLALIAFAGLAHLLIGLLVLRQFSGRKPSQVDSWLPLTVLKPLYGDEPLLYEALRSFCLQDYPTYQVIFGVRDAHDPALLAVRRLQKELQHVDIGVVVDAILHGSNRKVSNLMNMARIAKYDHYIISDSDMHVSPDYLRRIASSFSDPQVGLVTSLYTGHPVAEGMVSNLAISHINHFFLPSALVGMWLCRRSDCFGATMALSRQTLEDIGGWGVISDQLADDFVLGREVKAKGFDVVLAPVLPATTVAEDHWNGLIAHELRWARTIRAMVPAGFAASFIQYPVSFALMAAILSGGAQDYTALLAFITCARIGAARAIDRRLDLNHLPFWLIPVRDILSFCIMIASFFGRQIQWRGHSMIIEPDGSLVLKEIDSP